MVITTTTTWVRACSGWWSSGGAGAWWGAFGWRQVRCPGGSAGDEGRGRPSSSAPRWVSAGLLRAPGGHLDGGLPTRPHAYDIRNMQEMHIAGPTRPWENRRDGRMAVVGPGDPPGALPSCPHRPIVVAASPVVRGWLAITWLSGAVRARRLDGAAVWRCPTSLPTSGTTATCRQR